MTEVTAPGRRARSSDVVLGYAVEQVRQILGTADRVRLDAPESVHDMRVATRRLRSALTTFRPVFRGDAVRPLGVELRWLAGRLGAARDGEVLRDALINAVDALGPTTPGTDVVRREVATQTHDAYQRAHVELVAALDSERYRRLGSDLEAFTRASALTRRASRPAKKVLTPRTARAFCALADLVATASVTPTPEREGVLHEVRKAAKRARYAGETLQDAFGRPAVRFASAMKAVQEDLGEHLDSTATCAWLDDLVSRETRPAAAYVYGQLAALERIRGEQALAAYEVSWRAARRGSLRQWLR